MRLAPRPFQAARALATVLRARPGLRVALVACAAAAAAAGAAGKTWWDRHTTPLSAEALALDRLTTPLAAVPLPQYASDAEFAQALAQMEQIVGADNVSRSPDVRAAHADTFFSTHHPPDPATQRPAVVVYPANTEQVLALMKVAHHYRVPVVANSGLTSLEGHNMHTRGPNLVSLAFGNLSDVVAFHPDDMDVVVQAGMGWQELDEFLSGRADGQHLMFGPDPGMGATIGGMVGTLASGTNAYKYGTMKENVVHLTVVLADGTVVKTKRRPRKSSAGYDLTHVFVGSEGTLGIVTEICVRLHPRPPRELVCIAAFPSIRDAAAAAQHLISRSGVHANALELVNETTMLFVNQLGVLDKTFREQPSLLIKLGGPSDDVVRLQTDIVEATVRQHRLSHFELSHDPTSNAVLWGARRAALWSTFEYGKKVLDDPHDVQIWTTDFAVPISALTELIDGANADLNASGFRNRFSVMGHVGDGNCHFLLLYNSKDYARAKAVVDRIVDRTIRLDGTCTGEHGVGVGKRAYLEAELGVDAVDLMRHLKYALDPRAILNPDKVVKIDPLDNWDVLLHSGHAVETPKCC